MGLLVTKPAELMLFYTGADTIPTAPYLAGAEIGLVSSSNDSDA